MHDWTPLDSLLLKKLYNDDKLELLDICKIMKKKCKIIISKLIELQIVHTKYDIRGSNVKLLPPSPTPPSPFPTPPFPTPPSPTTNSIISTLNTINQVVNDVSLLCKLLTNVVEQYNK